MDIILNCAMCGVEGLVFVKTYSNDVMREDVYVCPQGHQSTVRVYAADQSDGLEER